ncbi:hypothetical protein GRAN_1547 [Granulicella sibirica]|uniref:Uncharacterized protein n=1 Tax=Granulicella sibirica TaxID=2479048 RepID=A0A4Q0T4I3_9BACT|nr:hypothetical protein GRAN_1547 [Granulicella sibirica]
MGSSWSTSSVPGRTSRTWFETVTVLPVSEKAAVLSSQMWSSRSKSVISALYAEWSPQLVISGQCTHPTLSKPILDH